MSQNPTLVGIFRARMRGIEPGALYAQEMAVRQAQRDRVEHERASWRLLFAVVVTLAIYLLIAGKMAVLAVSAPIETRTPYQAAQIYGGRSDIVDRNGRILATNLPGYSLYAHPHEMVDPRAAAAGLAKIFPELDADELYMRFTKEGTKFLWVKQQISPEQKEAVFNLGEPGLVFGKRQLRLFPNGRNAAHVLGGVKFGEEGVNAAEIEGQAGVEYAFNSFLSDPANAQIPLKLSIDLSVQDALQDVLSEGMLHTQSVGAAAIIMEADTGRVLAMASLPDFDPNRRPRPLTSGNDPSLDPRFNRAALGLYELGSTYKIFTAAMALETGYANPSTVIQIGHNIQSGSYKIADFHYSGESLSLHDVIVKSSNIGTARIARALGSKTQKAFLNKLGLLEPTDFELSEARRAQPLYPADKNWSDLSTMTISYGHGIAASPLHLASAYASMVNGGYRVHPTLLYELPKEIEREQVISANSSRQLRQMLRDVVASPNGTASFARTEGYDIGGKTGTADKLRPEGGYYKHKNVNTFAGAFPMSDPKYVIVVTLDEPKDPDGDKRKQTAGWTTVPVARQMVERIAPLLNLRPIYTSDAPIE